jgi:hypothetical protein
LPFSERKKRRPRFAGTSALKLPEQEINEPQIHLTKGLTPNPDWNFIAAATELRNCTPEAVNTEGVSSKKIPCTFDPETVEFFDYTE